MSLVIEQVKTNLEYYVLWQSVESHEILLDNNVGLTIISGYPPQKLHNNDEPHLKEWVIPQTISSQKELQLSEINQWFKSVERLAGTRPKRVTIGLLNNDSTVVYYFIHDGIAKPKQN